MKIPVMKPLLCEAKEVGPYLSEIDSNRMYSNFGPLLIELEKRFAKFFNVEPDKVVCSANATLAILGACQVIPGLTLELPSYTFAATVQAALLSGKNLVLSDIHLDTFGIIHREANSDRYTNFPDQIYVLPYGAGGVIPNSPPGAFQIIDAAASIGNYESQMSKIEAHQIFCFSLHATKVLGVGEGAVSVFGSTELAREFRTWINFGFNGSRESQRMGLNAKMSEITAAYAHVALDNFAVEKQDWLRVGERQYKIGEQLGINPKFVGLKSVTPYWIVEFTDSFLRARVIANLEKYGIETRIWWGKGCHTMKAFEKLAIGDFLNTEIVSSRVLGLPKYRDLKESEIDLIDDIVSRSL